MPKIINNCPVCGSKAIEKSHANFKDWLITILDCGHSYREKLSITSSDEIKLLDGKSLYKYQVEGVHFAERSNFSCLIGDEQGLGKTIQAVGLIHTHFKELAPILIVVKASLTIQWQKHILLETGKFAQIVGTKDTFIPGIGIYITTYDVVGKLESNIKSANIKTLILDECQMIKNHEAKRTNAIRGIVNLKVKRDETTIPLESLAPKVKIIANDLLKYHDLDKRFELKIQSLPSNILGLTRCRVKGEGVITGDIIISEHHIKTAKLDDIIETILHEIAHAITPGAGHRRIWQDTSLSIGGNGQAFANCEGTVNIDDLQYEKMIKNKIFLSGTPIKNNAIEYWPSLNLLRPEMFPNRADWLRWDVGYWMNNKGVWKPGGLRYPEQFKKKTSDFIIRRERAEVFPELPEITRDFRYHEITHDEMLAYTLGVKKLERFLEENNGKKDFTFTSQLQGHIMILRHITGLAKISPILDYIDEFAESRNNGNPWKLAIFHHHIDVGDILEKHISTREISLERIIAQDNAEKRTQKLDKFRIDDSCHILMLPSLAASEGFDLDFCDTGILLEREWNPANEEQIEGRFIRATETMLAKAREGGLKATLVYPIAVNTIDEFFSELVERKRQYVKETLRGQSSSKQWNESDIMLELAQIAIKRVKEMNQ